MLFLRAFFFIIWPKVFLQKSHKCFLSTSCFDEVIFAEIVFSGSQFITKFDQIFYHILTHLILMFLLCFMTLFQDNHKLVKARLV